MRFMMLIYPGPMAEAGVMPTAEQIVTMMKYNEELAAAGVLIALDGLHPTSKGARVKFEGSMPTVSDGPFTESKEILGGYWVIDVASKEDAVAWARKCPGTDCMIEVRQVMQMSDFPEDVQRAVDTSSVSAHLEAAGSR